jgi:16S rRNA processing protein RimM
VIALGRIDKPYGLKGEFSITLLTVRVERFAEVGRVFIGLQGSNGPLEEFAVQGARQVGTKPVLKLQGVDSRDAVGAVRGKYLLIPDNEEALLPPGEYYEHHIVGCAVTDGEGRDLGQIREILPMPAQDVYVVENSAGTWWLPAARALIESIDIDRKCITIRMIDGLLETGPAR